MKKYTLFGNIVFFVGLAIFVVGLIIRDSDSGKLATYQEHSTTIMITGIVFVLLTNFFRRKKETKTIKK